MELILVSIVLIAYLTYILFIRPIRIRNYYSRMFKAHGYKVFQYPYKLLSVPLFADWVKCQNQKNDMNYNGKHVLCGYDVIISNVFMRPQVIFLNDKLIQGFMDKDLQMMVSKMNIGFSIMEYMIKRGLGFIEKDAWKHRRALFSKIFNFDFITSQIPIMVQTSNTVFQKFEEQYWKASPQKKELKQIKIEVLSQMIKYTSSVVMAGFLGLESMKEQLKGKTIQEKIFKLNFDSIMLSRDPLNFIFGQKFMRLGLREKDRQFMKNNNEVNAILKSYLQQYRQKLQQNKKLNLKPRNTIVQLILHEIEKSKDTDNYIDIKDQDLIDEMKGFVFAGTDTTANYLNMLILYIYEHKHVLKKLRQQIQQYIQSDKDITMENIKKITYLDCVLQESTRHFAAAESGLGRFMQEDFVIYDIPFKKGTCLNLYTRPMFSNPQNFKDPLTFNPDRWEVDSEQTRRLQQMISYQFYGGPHGCLGKNLALTETKVMVIKFLSRYENLTEPGINNRLIRLHMITNLANSEAILQKY